MARRSVRLQEAGYYTQEGLPCISYKERLYRVFQRRKYHERKRNSFDPLFDEDPDWLPDSQTVEGHVETSRPWCSSLTILKYMAVFFLGLSLGFLGMRLGKQLHFNDQSELEFRANFALESQGARVLHDQSSDTYMKHRQSLSDWIFAREYKKKAQRRVIQGRSILYPGACWCFPEERGHLLVALSHLVTITDVTLGRITKSQSPGGVIASAPRDFSVYGLRTNCEEGVYLGRLRYDDDGTPHQTFSVHNPNNAVFRFVKLQVENNYGNVDYTCVYNFRVHGTPPCQLTARK